jgi:N,N'-diacetyllegionaminate synthase
MSTPVFVIAEAGVNHNGEIDLALRLCDAAKASGADAVKFQTFRAQDLVVPGAPTADYQKQQTGAQDQFAMLQKLELSQQMHEQIQAHCRKIDIEFFSTPFSVSAVEMLVRLGVQRIKLSSGELTHKALVMHAAATQLPLLISTGMANMVEISQALVWVQAARGHLDQVTVLHCTSAYPAPDASLHLRAMEAMRSELSVAVGYSDHSSGVEASIAAVAMGATVIEKHITLDKNLPGPDHQASLEPDEFALMVRSIWRVQAMRGDALKQRHPDEENTALVARRSVVAAVNIAAGQLIEAPMLECRRPATGIQPSEIELLIGARAKQAIQAGAVLQWQQVERPA